jgi:hypothetical protein
MAFLEYLKDITINISKDSDTEAERFLAENKLLDDVQRVINDLNKELRLSKNKTNFKLSISKSTPFLKHRDSEKLVQEWLNSNEKLTIIKKSFLTYLNDLHFE